MRQWALAVVTFALWAFAACGSHSQYNCEASAQCFDHGAQGTCEPSGFCAFPDPGCPSGDRYEPNAGGGLANSCVAPGTGIDSGVDGMPQNCGAVGMACCPDNTCGDNAFCMSGTCQQCVTDISVGGGFTCALRYDGTVWCSGYNNEGELGNGSMGLAMSARSEARDSSNAVISDATALASGDGQTCALRAGGAVWCWGENSDGQLGNNDAGTNYPTAQPVQYASNGAPLTAMKSLAVGGDVSCAVDGSSTAWCWGDNGDDQLGDGTTNSRDQAAQVLVAAAGAPFGNIAELAVGTSGAACARTTNNQIWCWGYNDYGQVGNGTESDAPSPVHVFDGISVSTGRHHTCAVGTDGKVWCWGGARMGRLGPGVDNNEDSPNPVLVSDGSAQLAGATKAVAAGLSCVVTSAKQAQCWGTNPHGQLGTGVGVSNPTTVTYANGTPLTGITRMLADHATVCAFLDTGALVCWGRNDEGEFGDGSFLSKNYPQAIKVTCP